MKYRPMFFYSQGDCGCSGVSSQTATPLVPCVGAVISDTRYLGLATAPQGQILIVPIGSNTQVFLSGATKGFVFFNGAGEGSVVASPQHTLTLLNPLSSGAHPVPSPWKYLTVGSGDPAEWRHLAAPTSGTYMLQTEAGVWKLVDVGTIPGLSAVGASGTYAPRAAILSLIEYPAASGIYVARKLSAVNGKPLIGIVDADGSHYQPIPDADTLTHLLGFFRTLSIHKVKPADAAGAPIANFEELPGGTTDAVRILYSPADEKFYRASAGVGSGGVHVTGGPTGVIATGSFSQILDLGNITIGTAIFVAFSCALDANNKIKVQLWMDGASIHEWDFSGTTSSSNAYSGSLYKAGLAEGTHAFELRARPYSSSETFTQIQGTVLKVD